MDSFFRHAPGRSEAAWCTRDAALFPLSVVLLWLSATDQTGHAPHRRVQLGSFPSVQILAREKRGDKAGRPSVLAVNDGRSGLARREDKELGDLDVLGPEGDPGDLLGNVFGDD
jgi:hypothetical protein